MRFLWDVRGGPENAPAKAILLFVCPENPTAVGQPEKPYAGPMAAIIIDDIGYNLEIVRALGALGRPLTLAVLPSCPHTRDAVQAASAWAWKSCSTCPSNPSGTRPPGLWARSIRP